ncbi:hypothetical protein [Streptomyces sp. NPDC096193]|uniref:hypothetical protein n=1 Tax=Streptomyces sp. NPDC096193 TaxID=3155821 RepID=UPI00332D230E
MKTLAKHLPGYGQCAVATILNSLSAAGHYRRVRQSVTSASGTNIWVWRSYWSRTPRDDAWWAHFASGELGTSTIPAALARTAGYDVLARLGRIEARLMLSASECAALEAAAGAWFERGATEGHLLSALTAGLPAQISHPYGFVRARLLTKLPPEPPAPRMILECTDCGAPGEPESLPGGLCRTCTGGDGLAAPLPAGVHDRVGSLRAALRDGPGDAHGRLGPVVPVSQRDGREDAIADRGWASSNLQATRTCFEERATSPMSSCPRGR